MKTIDILMQTIDALTKHASDLEARLAKYEANAEVSVEKTTEISDETSDAASYSGPTFENLLIQGRSKKTKELVTYFQSDERLDTTMKNTRYIASTVCDVNNINIADHNVLSTPDNRVAVCTLHENAIFMIDYTTGQTLHKLPITGELDPTALQKTINEEGWSIFTTTYETPSYSLEEQPDED